MLSAKASGPMFLVNHGSEGNAPLTVEALAGLLRGESLGNRLRLPLSD